MELKKNPQVDVYRLRNVFLNLGLLISISVVFAVFQYKTFDTIGVVDLGDVTQTDSEIVDIPLTTQPPPPPPKIQLPEVIEVANEDLLIDDLEIVLDIEMHEDTRIKEVEFDDLALDDGPTDEEADQIFLIVEQDAEPAGGIKAFYTYVASQLKDHYPAAALRMDIQGLVYIQFVVEKDGSITQVEVVKGIGSGCDELAAAVVENAPKWNPGKQRGRAVRTRKVIPIKFILH